MTAIKRFHDSNQPVLQPKTEGNRVLEYQRSTGRAGDRSPSSWTVKRFFDRIRTPPRRKSAGSLTAEIAHERSPAKECGKARRRERKKANRRDCQLQIEQLSGNLGDDARAVRDQDQSKAPRLLQLAYLAP